LDIIVVIPSNITEISANALRGTDAYHIVSIDFSQANSLNTIGSQACMYNRYLTGILEFPASLKVIDKSAFNGCENISGIVLPETLEIIGTTEAGGVFRDCSNLQFVRVTGGDPNAAFELPETLQLIGKQSCYKCTALPANTTVTIPRAVTFLGSEIFHYTTSVTTIIVETENASNYNSSAF